jgi:hypothetical protein
MHAACTVTVTCEGGAHACGRAVSSLEASAHPLGTHVCERRRRGPRRAARLAMGQAAPAIRPLMSEAAAAAGAEASVESGTLAP